jgi:hypothetical protein
VDVVGKIAVLDDRLRRLAMLIEGRRATSRNTAARLSNAEAWLQSGVPAGVVIVDYAEIDAGSVLKRNESPVAAPDRIRHRLRELSADEHRVRSAPLPAADARAQMRAAIERLAEHGTPDVSPLVEAGHDIVWQSTMTRLTLAAVVGSDGARVLGHAMGEVTDLQALLTWLLRDALIGRLEAEIDAVADDAAALSAEARAEKLAQIGSDRLAAERHEAALVRRMQDDGLPVEHRVDADVRAVLRVELVAVTTETAAAPYGLAARAAAHVARVFQIEPPL